MGAVDRRPGARIDRFLHFRVGQLTIDNPVSSDSARRVRLLAAGFTRCLAPTCDRQADPKSTFSTSKLSASARADLARTGSKVSNQKFQNLRRNFPAEGDHFAVPISAHFSLGLSGV